MTLAYAATDLPSGVKQVSATLNGNPVGTGETRLTRVGTNTFTLTATDIAGNAGNPQLDRRFGMRATSIHRARRFPTMAMSPPDGLWTR